jgi:tripartite ATP-independent transporter DctM subunit
MEKRGFNVGFTAGILAMGGLITSTFPPSLGLILFGVTGNVSIGRLFLAGIIPSLLMTVFLMVTVGLISKKRGYAKEHEKTPSFMDVLKGFWENIFALLFPIILIVGIRFGVFTPSEAGAFAVVYAFLIGTFVYRELSFNKLVDTLKTTATDLAVIMLIIICANAFGYVLVTGQVPQVLAQGLTSITTNPTILLVLVILFIFAAGLFMEATANVLLLVPIFLPILQGVGVDSVHFGVLFMIVVTMGGMTPPVGVAMYATCSILKCPIDVYSKEAVPFIIAILALLAVLIIFPDIVLFMPNWVYGASTMP